MGILGTADSRAKDRKKRPDELLSSVVRETSVPAVIELLRENQPFAFPSGTAWVMLLLNADAVGGLNKRHSRDEAKGSIIQLIESDQIKTVATAEMLATEDFGIIPTQDTLARMEEYSLLTRAAYDWAVVWQEKSTGDLIVEKVNQAGFIDEGGSVDVTTGFSQAGAVFTGAVSLQKAVGDRAWGEHSGMSMDAGAPPATESDFDAPETAQSIESLDDDPIFDQDPVVDEPVFEEVLGDEDEPPSFDDSLTTGGFDAGVEEMHVETPEDEFDGFDESDTGYNAAEEFITDEVLVESQDQVRQIIARRFLSDDLDLQIRLDEFDATFAIGAPSVAIETPEGATEWLGDQIAQRSRQANADLAQLRSAHEDELRALYVNLSSAHAEQVIRDVATDREGSRYKALKESAEIAHQERIGAKDQEIRNRKAEIAQNYEDRASRLAQQAAVQAELQFKERNQPKLEREQADAVAEVERIIENDWSQDLREILRVRRSAATLKMQVGSSRIFEVLAEKQSEYLAVEETRLAQWASDIQKMVDENRKADIVQYEALAEHQRTSDAIGELRRDQDSRVEHLRTEHADRIRRMEEELERDRKDAITRMQAREAEWRHSLNIEQEKLRSQTEQNTDLRQQVENAEQFVGRRYEARISELWADKQSSANELARVSEMTTRSNKIVMILMVTVPLLALLAGFVGGLAV